MSAGPISSLAPIEMSTPTTDEQHGSTGSEPRTPPSALPPVLVETTPLSHNQSGTIPHRSSGKPASTVERLAHKTEMDHRVLTPHCHASSFLEKFFPDWKGLDTLPTLPDGVNKANGKEFVSAISAWRSESH